MSAKVSDIKETAPPEEAKVDEDAPRNAPLFFIFLCTLCIGSIYANVASYQMTINLLHSYGNGSDSDFYGVDDYREVNNERINFTVMRHKYLSNPQKESLVMVVPIGALIAVFPIAYLYNHQGFRRTLAVCVLMSVIPSLLVPLFTAAPTFALAILVRITQGFAMAAFVPYVCKLAVFLPFDHIAIPSIVFAYYKLAAIATFPIAGILCWSALGWHAAHYIPAILSFFLLLVFLIIHFDDEFKERATHGGIMQALCTYERSRSAMLNFRLPYLSIYQDVRIWAFFIAAFGFFTSVHLYLQFGPTFLFKVVGHSILSTGFLSLLPPTINLILSFAVYGIFPKLANTVTNKMRVFNSLGTFIPGGLLMLMGLFDPSSQPGAATTIYLLACCTLGFCACGFFRAVQLRSGKYHLFLLLNLFVIELVSMFLTSLFNVLIAKENEYSLWTAVFVLHGAILVTSNIVFIVFATDEVAPWAKEGYEDTSIRPYRADPLPQRPL